MINYDKAIAALDEWIAAHENTMYTLSQPTEKLFLDVFGEKFSFSRADNVMLVMSKFNAMLMREILKDANKC